MDDSISFQEYDRVNATRQLLYRNIHTSGVILRIRRGLPIKAPKLHHEQGRQPRNALGTRPHGIASQNVRIFFNLTLQTQFNAFHNVCHIRGTPDTTLNVAHQFAVQIVRHDSGFLLVRVVTTIGQFVTHQCFFQFQSKQGIHQIVCSHQFLRIGRNDTGIDEFGSGRREQSGKEFFGILLLGLSLRSALRELGKDDARGLYERGGLQGIGLSIEALKGVAETGHEEGVG